MIVEILTIRDDTNYGNRLQNYALLQLLEQYSETHTLRVKLDSGSHQNAFQLVKHLAKNAFKILIKYIPVKASNKRVKFLYFDTEVSEKGTLSIEGLRGIDYEPEIIVIGSDQVWNYSFGLTQNDLRVRLGMSLPRERIVAYAASIGLDKIDEEWRSIFKEGWLRIPHISVREDRAAELVKEISGREVAVVLDPTLMLSPEQWGVVFTDFVPKGDHYILTYFLGRPSDRQEKVMSSVAESLGVRIRRINDTRDRETYVAGPAEFVELFAKAQYVFTDSYHACCFSIIYNKPFKVFNRDGFAGKESMNSRMRTLFRLFELDDLMDDDEAIPVFDWMRINCLLEQHRAQSRKWLENALGVGATGRA